MDFQAQQAAGAWAIGVGSAWQAGAAMASGIQRVLMVNQLVGKANMQLIAQLQRHYPTVDFICCIDSIETPALCLPFCQSATDTERDD